MASSISISPMATFPAINRSMRGSVRNHKYFSPTIRGSPLAGLSLTLNTQLAKAAKRSFPLSYNGFKTAISCSSTAQPETLQTVQSIIAKQLSIEESAVTPQTKFTDLGADSLDTVEIMMALEEKFGVSIGEEGAQNIATVQDAADLIEKVMAAPA